MLLVHRRDVVEAIEISNSLQVGLVLDQLFGATVEEADMGINPLNDLAVKFQHEPQDPVCCRMHRPKINDEVALGHLRVGDPTVKSGKLPARSTTFAFMRSASGFPCENSPQSAAKPRARLCVSALAGRRAGSFGKPHLFSLRLTT